MAGLNMRTTSSIESMNSQLRRSFPKHGSIWKFVEQLKYHEFSKATEMIKLTEAEVTEQQLGRKIKKDKEREVKIKFFTKLLKKNEISIDEFIEAMGGKVIFPGIL